MSASQPVGDDLSIPTAPPTVTPTVSDEAARLLDQLLPLYDQLAEQTGSDPQLLREAAKASQRVGDIQHRLGRLALAETAYQRAIVRYRDLESFGPLDKVTQLGRARTHACLATIWNRLRKTDQATAELLRTIALLKPLAVSSPTPDVRLELARTHSLLGVHQRPTPGLDLPAGPTGPTGPPHGPPHGPHGGHPPPQHPPGPHDRRPPPGAERGHPLLTRNADAVEQLETAIELLSDLLATNSRQPEFRHLLALCHGELATGDFSDPRPDHFEQSVSILQALCEEFPKIPDYQFNLSDIYARVPMPVRPDQWETSEERLKRALPLSAKLVEEHPHVADYMELHVHNHHRLAHVLRQSHRPSEATAHMAHAFDFQSRLVRRHPEVLVHRLWQARIARNYARVLPDPVAAFEMLSNMIAELESLTPSDADRAAVNQSLDELRQTLSPNSAPVERP